MDTFAHAFWAGAAAQAANKKLLERNNKKPLSIWRAAFWGVFPDFFALTPAFIWLVWGWLVGSPAIENLTRVDQFEPAVQDAIPIVKLIHSLYNLSHSAIVFLAVFGLAYLLYRRPTWELFGWLAHILIDIPTHTYRFFPTPVLWPISGWKFDGLSWATPWFMAINYSAIIIVYLYLFRLSRRNR